MRYGWLELPGRAWKNIACGKLHAKGNVRLGGAV
jgi:hypothetical protein